VLDDITSLLTTIAHISTAFERANSASTLVAVVKSVPFTYYNGVIIMYVTDETH
jgi:hypothetical protein